MQYGTLCVASATFFAMLLSAHLYQPAVFLNLASESDFRDMQVQYLKAPLTRWRSCVEGISLRCSAIAVTSITNQRG